MKAAARRSVGTYLRWRSRHLDVAGLQAHQRRRVARQLAYLRRLPVRGGGDVPLMPDYVRRSVNQASDDVQEYQVLQWGPDDVEVRLRLAEDADRPAIESAIRANLAHWASRAGGQVPALRFTGTAPERDATSHKLVRVLNRSPR